MINKELEKKLESFLNKNNREFNQDSINYLGLRECGTIDGKIGKFHIISYLVSISIQPYDGDVFFYARFDEKTNQLVEIVGPQSWEKIEE